MGEVYEATEPNMGGRKVALKLLSPRLRGDPGFVRRLRREAQIAAGLKHPSIVQLFDTAGIGEDPAYISMEYLEGETLQALLDREGRLPHPRVLALLLPVLEGLVLAHARGVEHRDLKPDNLFLSQEPGGTRLKILDFGIAQVRQAGSAAASAHIRLGNPLFSAPELHEAGAGPPGQADVFSMGVILYYALTGKPPFPVSTLLAAQHPPRPLRELVAVPAELARLVGRMLSGDAAARPTMAEVAQRCAHLLQANQRSHRRLGVAAALALGALGLAVLLWSTGRRGPAVDLRARALRVLQEGVSASSPRLRNQAISGLMLAADPDQQGLLEGLLADGDAAVSGSAAEALARLGAHSAVPTLARALAGLGPGAKRLEVAGALAMLGDPAQAEVLRQALADPRLGLRAALLLCEVGDPGGRQALERLQERAQPRERVALLRHLLRCGAEGAGAALERHLRGPEVGEQLVAAAALLPEGRAEARELLQRLAAQPGPQRLSAARILADAGECSGRGLFRAVLGDAARTVPERTLAVEGLGRCGQLHEDQRLLGDLLDPSADGGLRLLAAGALLRLARQDPDQGLALARASLDSGSWLAREAGVALLGALPGPAAPQDLQRLLARRQDPRREVRLAVVGALARRGGQQGLSALVGALGDDDAAVRVAAADAMRRRLTSARRGEVSTAELHAVKQQLRALAAQGSAGARVAASAVLVDLGEEAARSGLEQALGDPDLAVRFYAARRLAAGGGARVSAVLREVLAGGGPDGLIAYGLLRRLLHEVVEQPRDLRRTLASGDLPTRFAVVVATAELNGDEAVPYLLQALFDPAAAVRRLAAEVAAELRRRDGHAGARRVLEALRGDPDLAVRLRVAALLAEPDGQPRATGEAVAPGPAEAGERRGYLLVQAEELVRFQLDRGPERTADGKALSVAAGRHSLRYLDGRVLPVTVPAERTVAVRIPAARVEQVLFDAATARQQRRYDRAQRLIEQARGVLRQGQARFTGDYLLEQSRLHEAQDHIRQAMEGYEAVLGLAAAQRRPEALAGARERMAQLSPRLGKVRICCTDGGVYKESVQWLFPGQHTITGCAGNQLRATVRVRERAEARVGVCRQ